MITTSDDDPLIGEFLAFLAGDMQNNPSHLQAINPTLHNRARTLVCDVGLDLDAPLSDP